MESDNIATAKAFLKLYPQAKLFPARWDTENKRHQPLTKWGREFKETSNTIPQLEQWDRDFKHLNVYYCIAAEQSNITIIDVDDKNGKNGSKVLEELQAQYGPLPETLRAQTPSGGKHYIFQGSCALGANKLGPGVDIPVMIPVPGSLVHGKGPYQIENWAGLAPLPEFIPRIAGERKEQKPGSNIPLIEPDDPIAISTAIQYLIHQAPEAIQGNHGDQTTCDVARMLHDMGVHPDRAIELMYEHWNFTKARPDWTLSELTTKVFSSYRSCNDPIGCKHPSIEYQGIDPSVIASAYATPMQNLIGKDLKKKWLVKKYIKAGTLNLFFGDHSALKSFLVLDMAAAIATGQPWAGRKTDPGPVFYFAGEGRDGMSLRITALSQKRGLGEASLPLYLINPMIRLDTEAGAQDIIKNLSIISEQSGQLPKLLIFDTLATSIGMGDENDTKGMNNFMNNIKTVQRAFPNAAVIVVHHTGHSHKDRARGASALEAGMDSVFKVTRDKENGVVCLKSPSKMKDGAPAKDAWFRVESIILDYDEDGDEITSLVLDFDPEYAPETDKAQIRIQKPKGAIQRELYALFENGEVLTIEQIRREMESRFPKRMADSKGRTRWPNITRGLVALVDNGHLEHEGEVYFRPEINRGILGPKLNLGFEIVPANMTEDEFLNGAN